MTFPSNASLKVQHIQTAPVSPASPFRKIPMVTSVAKASMDAHAYRLQRELRRTEVEMNGASQVLNDVKAERRQAELAVETRRVQAKANGAIDTWA